jgi:hypothetical protein
MDSKYCSACAKKLPISSFLKDASANPGSKVLKTCLLCRNKSKSKRKALQPLDPNIPAKRQRPPPVEPLTHLEPLHPHRNPVESLKSPPEPAVLPPLLKTRPELSTRPPTSIQPPPLQHQTTVFLPAEQWGYIQGFYAAMDQVKMETCSRCNARWFSMDLKDQVCHACFLRDQGGKTPFLMSAENRMDPGELPAYLPALTRLRR